MGWLAVMATVHSLRKQKSRRLAGAIKHNSLKLYKSDLALS